MQITQELKNYILELFYEIEGVLYLEENTEINRNALQLYLQRKKFTLPKVYDNFEYHCGEVNNNGTMIREGQTRVDVFMYVDKEYDNLVFLYDDKTDVYLNSKKVLTI